MTTFLNQPVTLEGRQPSVGETMPDFTVLDASMNPVDPVKIPGKKIILSVPSLDTPVCSLELGKFLHYMKNNPQIKVISVSEDLPFALARWNKAQENEGTILTTSDFPAQDFSSKTGTRMKENGLLTRAAFVVDEDGKIIYEQFVDEVSHEPDYIKILEAAGLQ
ncbi:thiol peroxidase [Allobaculum mucilyticum]|uniref:thiol peroxidase n=1 Tax=Allobaculum mucilyticum TaxID=2834459 RepID=UPI001E305EDE|nr:thiol peroxidase [Allobaculum mucilyticum]UNT96491.1 thiol peroxidase [Allobaculum mucilyticum]